MPEIKQSNRAYLNDQLGITGSMMKKKEELTAFLGVIHIWPMSHFMFVQRLMKQLVGAFHDGASSESSMDHRSQIKRKGLMANTYIAAL